MNICVLSKDLRYRELEELLRVNNYVVLTPTDENLSKCDILVLSVVPEFDDNELIRIGDLLKKDTVVFSGKAENVGKLLQKNVIDYSYNEGFLQENAEITAEAALFVIYNETKQAIKNKRVLVCGYGRIGKHLCKILSNLGADIFVFARRKEIQDQILKHGYLCADLENLPTIDIVLNTVPSVIFKKEMLNKIPKSVCLIELASKPGGYEETVGVIDGGRLPGRILPKSGAYAIYSTITSYFPYKKG